MVARLACRAARTAQRARFIAPAADEAATYVRPVQLGSGMALNPDISSAARVAPGMHMAFNFQTDGLE
jgi:hypothetical protein